MLKTKMNIADAYLKLVAKNSILNVSNDAIIDASGVSRGTFYNNFTDQKDILDYVQVKVNERLVNQIDDYFTKFPIEQTSPGQAILVMSEVFVPAIYEQREMISLLNRCDLNHLWEKSLKKECAKFVAPMVEHFKDSNIDYSLLISFAMIIIESWITDDQPTDAQEFKSTFCNLYKKTINGLL
ncbi:TetR/AcrR family transcriptional regulator [Nicoliella lavandulae]|uniref:TetR/AcrR family transcriptional regulator n=1 Tax=Nicoliella lavandulae TaxID=3082954 RepID=A0ABU8SIU3_9LACO